MKNTEECMFAINKALSEIQYPTTAGNLFAPVKYQLDMGGKRIRPLLALMACNMFGGKLSDVIAPAIGIEIFHNFTLLHDDVMDKADIRRGLPTVHKAWNENAAILSGDAMLIMAYKKIGESPCSVLKQVLDIFTLTAIEICEGQQYDMEFETRNNVTEKEYIEMIRLKTAVLIGCALKIGAITAFAPDKQAEAVYRFGVNIGIAFQLQDDYLDVYGDPVKFGKKIGGDILNNKKTYMLISACDKAKGDKKERLLYLLESKRIDASKKISGITQLYTELGIDKLACDKIDEYYKAALKELESIPSSDTLAEFANELMQRQS